MELSYSSSPYDLTSEDQELPEDRARKRSKFWRKSGEWKFSQEPPDVATNILGWDESILNEDEVPTMVAEPQEETSGLALGHESNTPLAAPSSLSHPDMAKPIPETLIKPVEEDVMEPAASTVEASNPLLPILTSTSLLLPNSIIPESRLRGYNTSISTLEIQTEPTVELSSGRSSASPVKTKDLATAVFLIGDSTSTQLAQKKRAYSQFGSDGSISPRPSSGNVDTDNDFKPNSLQEGDLQLNGNNVVRFETVQSQPPVFGQRVISDVSVRESAQAEAEKNLHNDVRHPAVSSDIEVALFENHEQLPHGGTTSPYDRYEVLSDDHRKSVDKDILHHSYGTPPIEAAALDEEVQASELSAFPTEQEDGEQQEETPGDLLQTKARDREAVEESTNQSTSDPVMERKDSDNDGAAEVLQQNDIIGLAQSSPQLASVTSHIERIQKEKVAISIDEHDLAVLDPIISLDPFLLQESTTPKISPVLAEQPSTEAKQLSIDESVEREKDNTAVARATTTVAEPAPNPTKTNSQKKKRSKKKRQSVVPNIISPWFTSRHQKKSPDPESDTESVVKHLPWNNAFVLVEAEGSDADKQSCSKKRKLSKEEVLQTSKAYTGMDITGQLLAEESKAFLLNRNGKRTLTDVDITLPFNKAEQTQADASKSLENQAEQLYHKEQVRINEQMSVGGLRTALSYYSPLSGLEQHINQTTTDGSHILDFFGVVTLGTAPPLQAKAGPKDWSTVFRITDSSITGSTVRVQVFRHYKSALPEAGVGDVILLRNFVVKSRKRQSFLLSAKTSAWLVWRTSGRQECKGPPVEVGVDEQEHAIKLRKWRESAGDVGNSQ